jgi:uncharacterized protein with von Willebrand factor type A (vWA) domain
LLAWIRPATVKIMRARAIRFRSSHHGHKMAFRTSHRTASSSAWEPPMKDFDRDYDEDESPRRHGKKR